MNLMKKSLVILCLAAGIVTGPTSTSFAQTSDAWITMKTKLALMTSDGVSAVGLNVDTVDGVVTLHGKVATEAQKKKAEDVARTIEGTKSVKNVLQVVPPPQADQVTAHDADVEARVKAALKSNSMVANSDIRVASVNKGVVLLSGNAKTLETHVRAVELAASVNGVKRVATEVVVDER